MQATTILPPVISRHERLGGSDIAAVLGVDPYRSPLDVYRDKTAPRETEAPPSHRMRVGLALEPLMAEFFTERTGEKIVQEQAELYYPAWHIGGHVDGITETGAVVEFKTTVSKKSHDRYLPQISAYVGLTNAPYAWLAVYDFVKGEFTARRISREELQPEAVRDYCAAWWERHVIPRIPPPHATREDIKALWEACERGEDTETVTLSADDAAKVAIWRAGGREAPAMAAIGRAVASAPICRMLRLVDNEGRRLATVRADGAII